MTHVARSADGRTDPRTFVCWWARWRRFRRPKSSGHGLVPRPGRPPATPTGSKRAERASEGGRIPPYSPPRRLNPPRRDRRDVGRRGGRLRRGRPAITPARKSARAHLGLCLRALQVDVVGQDVLGLRQDHVIARARLRGSSASSGAELLAPGFGAFFFSRSRGGGKPGESASSSVIS